jgi:hypothetical protein
MGPSPPQRSRPRRPTCRRRACRARTRRASIAPHSSSAMPWTSIARAARISPRGPTRRRAPAALAAPAARAAPAALAAPASRAAPRTPTTRGARDAGRAAPPVSRTGGSFSSFFIFFFFFAGFWFAGLLRSLAPLFLWLLSFLCIRRRSKARASHERAHHADLPPTKRNTPFRFCSCAC